MVKRIEKTYSVKNDQIKKSVTLSTEESLSSQSPTSYSSNTPVKYGLIDDTIRAVLDMIKLGGVDKFCGSCKWMKEMGLSSTKVDKLCGYCNLMKEMGLLDAPTAESGDKSSYTKVGYDGIYGGGNPLYDFIAESNDTPTYYQNEIVF